MILLTGSFLSVTFREKEREKGLQNILEAFRNHDTDTSDGQESKEKRRGKNVDFFCTLSTARQQDSALTILTIDLWILTDCWLLEQKNCNRLDLFQDKNVI